MEAEKGNFVRFRNPHAVYWAFSIQKMILWISFTKLFEATVYRSVFGETPLGVSVRSVGPLSIVKDKKAIEVSKNLHLKLSL